MDLQVNDVVEIISKRKVGTRSVAVKMWDEGDIHHELNYWIIHSIEDCGESYYVTGVPDTSRGPCHCGFGCMHLHKSGKGPKKFSPDWTVVGHITPSTFIHHGPRPGDRAYDLLC